MSSDYCNLIAALPAPRARSWFGRLQGARRSSDLIDPDGQTLAVVTPAEPLDVASVARRYAGRRPAPGQYGTAYVRTDPEPWIESLAGEDSPYACVVSMGDPILAALDRVVALPAAVPLLEGQGIARLRPKRRARVARQWLALVRQLGGPRGVARLMAPHLREQGRHAATEEMIAEIERLFRCADSLGSDLLMFVTPT
jgi:hypothetical protein